jgi:5-hydroxyisourate hydrolase
MNGITTHVLDTARGRPAAGVGVTLERLIGGEQWEVAGKGRTDDDGRLRTLLAGTATAAPGVYRLTFDTAAYFSSHGLPVFYPHVTIAFTVAEGEAHYHVPLLLSPYGYSTYRGS